MISQGIHFYNRFYDLVIKNNSLGLSNKASVILNEDATLIGHLLNKLYSELRDLESNYQILMTKKETTTIVTGQKYDPMEKAIIVSRRYLEIEIRLLFSLLRSFLDEIHRYLIKPNIKVGTRELKDSFHGLFKKQEIMNSHSEYFKSIKFAAEKLFEEVIDPRDEFEHFSQRFRLKRNNEKKQWEYAIVLSKDIEEVYWKSEDPKLDWKSFNDINNLLDYLMDVIEKTTSYIKLKK